MLACQLSITQEVVNFIQDKQAVGGGCPPEKFENNWLSAGFLIWGGGAGLSPSLA